MVEQDPWVGSHYESDGIRGQRLGIVGYSDYLRNDDINYTIRSVEYVIARTQPPMHFFNNIASYFGTDGDAFYERVVYFEFVPCAIGGSVDKYRWATPEVAEAGRQRTLRIANERAIDKLLFFSSKAWRSMPQTIEWAGGTRSLLGDTKFEFGHHQAGDRLITSIGLRHPQFAPGALMRSAVEQALSLPVERAAISPA